MRMKKRSVFKPRAKGTYRIENKKDESDVYIYDEIGWFGVEAGQFVKDLNAINTGTIHLHVNSPGGSVFDGVAIYNALKQHKSKIIAHIDGLAASISSVIVLGADEVMASESAFFMIHEPWSIVIGDSQTMRDEADLLDKVGGTIAKTYMDKSGKTLEEVSDLMAAETWFTAQEALDAGFIDSIEETKKAKAKAVLFDLSAFANTPENLMENHDSEFSERDFERILRDAGCSAKLAKTILSGGYPDADQRDVDLVTAPQAKESQRDVEQPKAESVDWVSTLLTKAELEVPTTIN